MRAIQLAARRAAKLLSTICAGLALAAIASAAVDDTVVHEIRIAGNKLVSTEAITGAMKLRAGGPLSRELVLADVDRIESLYTSRSTSARVVTDMTHPGEREGNPRTVMTFTITEGAKPLRRLGKYDDPLEVYYSNTLVCAAAQTLNDLCHLWLNRDGSFINFDAGEAKAGHYTTGPVRPDGKLPVCQYWDAPEMVTPAEIPTRGPAPPPAAAPAAARAAPAAAPAPGPGGPGVMICRNINHRTTCQRGVDPATLTEEERKGSNLTMGERFHRGMCYPIGPQEVGDIWFEADDPLPGQLGMDRMLLLPGRQ